MSDERLTLASAKLARAAPELWKEFMDALAARTHTHVATVISSPISELVQHQGRAQSLTALLSVLSTCVKDADRIEARAQK